MATKIADIEITVGQALRAIAWFLLILFLIFIGIWFFTNYEIKNRVNSEVKKRQEESVTPPCPVDDKKAPKQIIACPGITPGNQKGVTDPNDLYDSGALPSSQQQNPGMITNSDQVKEIAKQQALQEALNEIKNF